MQPVRNIKNKSGLTSPGARRPGALVLALLAGVLCGASGAADALTTAEYNALIKRARDGDYEPALIMLREQAEIAPRNRRAAYDRIIIAGWAEKNEEVIEAYEALPDRRSLPADVLGAVARAYRYTQRWPEALALYEDGMRRYPGDPGFAVGETMTLADAGRLDEAMARGRSMTRRYGDNADARLALAYVYGRQGEHYAALYEADRANDLAPKRDDIAYEYLVALEGAGLADPARRMARERPDLLDPEQARQMEADAAAEMVRLSAIPGRGEESRYDVADRALARYDELIPAWKALGDPAQEELRRVRIDRLSALHARTRMAEVVAEYEALRDEGIEVPRYALNDVASAYLYLRRPEEAEAIYTQVLQEREGADDPQERMITYSGLYYAQAEAEHHMAAARTIQELQAGLTPWRYVKGQPERVPNELWMQGQLLGAIALNDAGDGPGAQQSLEEMVDAAPNNSLLRTALAEVYREHEQPRASEIELKLAETRTPRNVEVELGQAYTAMQLQEWRQAELLHEDLMKRYPELPRVQRLDRAWEVHNMSELRVEGYRGISQDSPVSGSGDFGIESVLYSPPLGHDWRAFGGIGYANGKFEEGRANYRWARAGAQWRVRDLTVEAEASAHNYGHGVKPGARLSAAYDVDDQWQVGGGAEIRSRDTPLRALNQDISSNSLSGYVRWRNTDRSEWTFSLAPSRFTDGNHRLAVGVTGRERVYTSPSVRADVGLEAFASRNTRRDAPYFNPRGDLTILPNVQVTHTLYRRYETAWEQTFTAGAGSYTQRSNGTGAIMLLGYGQRYRANDTFELGATVTGVSRPYDGNRERELRIVFDMTFRF